jgi:starch synthase
VPSLFEPCGLTQLYAMKYGTVPIVRATGGLRDTVQQYDMNSQTGTGFVFEQYSASALFDTVMQALSVYQTSHWDVIRRNGMSADFSSARSAAEYIRVFGWAAERRQTLLS